MELPVIPAKAHRAITGEMPVVRPHPFDFWPSDWEIKRSRRGPLESSEAKNSAAFATSSA
jgi:hypothetical protein